MLAKRYDWKRYWIPKEKDLPLDEHGFLLDPQENPTFGWSQTNDAVGFDSLTEAPCLVLLGEPGMGKSDTVKMAEVLTREAVIGTDAQVFHCNLGDYTTDWGLLDGVFGSEEFKSWQTERCPLHLFLDSLDECRISIPTVARLLGKKLQDLRDTRKLFLRITCRIGDWPESLEGALIEKWGDGVPKTLILAPLTRSQVAQSARDEGQDAAAFVEAVISRELVPFARSPLTLRFLLGKWARSKAELPNSLRDLYEAGCRELCVDPPERMRETGRTDLPIDQRLAMASSVAAGMIFGGRQTIWASDSEVGRPDGALSLADLAGRQVTIEKGTLLVTGSALQAVLSSGLFTSRGPHLYTWAHKTYAEFLAARWLEQEGLKPKQILDLLTSPVDGEGKLVPQLHQTAAWAAKPETDLFRHLLGIQPDILLGSDLAVTDDSTKEHLLKAVLEAVEEDRLSEGAWTLHKRWRKLRYPGMASVLRERLTDTRLESDTRKAVIHIVTCEGCRELVPELVEIALAPHEDPRIRLHAARAVDELGEAVHRAALIPLALGLAGPDPNLELRGFGLKVCWPNHLSAEQLFTALGEVAFESGFEFRSFLNTAWHAELKAEDLIPAMEWIGRQGRQANRDLDSFRDVMFRLFDAATAHLGSERVVRALAGAIACRLGTQDDLRFHKPSALTARLREDSELRHRVVQIALSAMTDPAKDGWFLAHTGLNLIRPEDSLWLISKMADTRQVQGIRIAWGELVQRRLDISNHHDVDALLTAHAKDSTIEGLCPRLLRPVMLDSEKAIQLKSDHALLVEGREIATAPPPAPESPTNVAIERWLDRFDRGELDGWMHVCLVLAFGKGQQIDDFGVVWDLRKMRKWAILEANVIPRILSAADMYIRNQTVAAEAWFSGKHGYPFGIIAGLHALVVLQGLAPDRIGALPTEVWDRWMPAILRVAEFGTGESRKRLVEVAFQYAPDAAESWTVKCVKAAIEEQSGFSFLAWLPAPIRPSLSQSLLRLIQSEAAAPNCVAGMVEILWHHPLSGLAGWLEEFLQSSDATTPRHADRTSLLCQVLVTKANADVWPWIWDVIKRSDEVGRAVFTTMAERSYHFELPRILVGVTEGELARLWEWAVRQFPPAEYPQKHGSGTVTQAEQIAGSRDHLLMHLGRIGTSGSCEQLARLAQDYPQFSWVRQLERQAFANRRKNEWQPIDPKLLFQMPRSPHSRWVESEPQLLGVILDSLERCEERLQGTNPLARMLWDDAAKSKKPTPKQEDAVSDWVTSELRRDLQAQGIVLNREVVVRPADRLDILVEAICPDSKTNQFRAIRVIIEVKRDFNAGIDHAMETQLSERYLADNGCRTGLYLVAWFNRNRQRGEKAQERLREFRAKLEAQAAKASIAGKNLRAWVLDCCLLKASKQVKSRKPTKPPKRSKPAGSRPAKGRGSSQ